VNRAASLASSVQPSLSGVGLNELRQAIPDARDLLFDALRASGLTALLDAARQRNARPLLFAGAVRDAIHAAEHRVATVAPRDFDIGLVGASRDTFDGLLSEFGARPNRYGGYRLLHTDAPSVDAWRLEETLGLRVHGVRCDILNVLRSFVLDINAVVFDPLTGLFHSRGAVEAIRAQRIGLVADPLVHSGATFAAKALLSSIRLSFALTEPLEQFAWRHLQPAITTYEATKVFGRLVCLGPIHL
jgi:hypothetical protein